jgi:glycosyltransferase involved in cell wall biosynthesis
VTDISVLTPSLGYGRYIEDSIRSVIEQRGISIQHVIQDGGSTDDTLAVLRRYGRRTDWVSEPDTGQSDALNKALERATGRWVAWLNADEFYLPDALAELVHLGDSTHADVVYGDSVFVDEAGRMMRLAPTYGYNALSLRLHGCFIPSYSSIFRRSSLLDQPWDATVKVLMDWDLYLSLASRGARFERANYPVGAFRRHSAQITAQLTDEVWAEYSRLFERYGIAPSSRRWGRWIHRSLKVADGAYVRQMKAAPFRGVSLRWFHDEPSREMCRSLLSACYDHRTIAWTPDAAGQA